MDKTNLNEVRTDGIQSDLLAGVKIARISTVPFFVLTQLRHQIESIAGHGAEVTIVTSAGPEFSILESLAGIRCESIEISRSISLWQDFMSLLRIFRFLKRSKIKIVHSTTPKAGLLTAIAAFFAGVPIRLHTFTGQPWISMKWPVSWFARWSDWLIGKLNTRCYTDSESQRRFLVDKRVLDPARLFVIGAGSLAGVDMDRFDGDRFSGLERIAMKASLQIPTDAPVLLFVGRITVDKGIRELLAAFDKLKRAGAPAHLVLAGPFESKGDSGGDISRQDIEYIPDTHIVGYTECPEAYMAIADILCLPSYREGFGTVVIEAGAMEVPTVGTDIYGLSDAVVNGHTGILVPPYDATALAIALSDLLGDDKRRLQMGCAAKRRAEELFSAQRFNQELIQEYRNLLVRMKAQ